jgi:Putative peptidoglycan binding domain/LysM domain
VDFAIHCMKPEAGAIVRNHDFRRGVNDHKIVPRLSVVHQLTNVNVRVALGPALDAVVSDAPLVAPQFFAFNDRLCEEFGAVGRAKVMQGVRAGSVFPRQRQNPVRLLRVSVLQKEHPRIDWLLFGLAAKAAVDGFHGIRLRDVAGAVAHVCQNQGQNYCGEHSFLLCSFFRCTLASAAMSSTYRVKQGDHISGIARQFGFSDYQTLWNDPNNAALKALRVNPNVLFPGDQVYIPDLVPSEFPRPTDAMHKFDVHVKTLKICLVLEDLYEKPIAGAACTLQVGYNKSQLTTDGSGQLQQEVAPDAKEGSVTIMAPQTPVQGTQIPIKIGHLDPVEEVSGQQARLQNLGYYLGKIGGTGDAELESAIEEFQCDAGIGVDGICGPATQAKLKQVHGC